MGYYIAGMKVVGVDNAKQLHYPFEFHYDDALHYLKLHGKEYDLIHASPPCQKYSVMTRRRWKNRLDSHPDLIAKTRDLLIETGKPYVIENVVGAPLVNPVLLCGTMFGLQTRRGLQLRRHRLFETSFPIGLAPTCNHKNGCSTIGQNGKKMPNTIGVWGHSGGRSKRDGLLLFRLRDRMDAMGINWMTCKELSEAIPPAYTRWIAERFMQWYEKEEK